MRSPGQHVATAPRYRLLTALAVALAVSACGDATDPGDFVDFPTVPPSQTAAFCIRGQAVPTASINGSISASDCSGGGRDGFWESWHVRVANSGTVTFEVDAAFGLDAALELFRIGSVGNLSGTLTLLAADDDGGPGLEPLIQHPLQTDTDYLILVSGGADDTGTYTLDMTGP